MSLPNSINLIWEIRDLNDMRILLRARSYEEARAWIAANPPKPKGCYETRFIEG